MKKEKSKASKGKKVKKIILIIVAVILALILAAGATFAILYYKGKKTFTDYKIDIRAPGNVEEVEVTDNGEYVTYKGEKYEYNRNIASILLLGVDRPDISEECTPGTAGQADAVYLLVLDSEKRSVKVLVIPRDTVTEISKYSSEGKYIGVEQAQICLAYAYGNGRETSAANMKEAVSRLMYGIPVHAYVTLGRKSVGILSDVVGGVEVPAYNEYDEPLGYDITVSGNDAVKYVRGRREDIADANLYRVHRQKDFMDSFAAKLGSELKSDVTVALDLYNSMTDEHMDTDIDVSQVTYLATNYIKGVNGVKFSDLKGEMILNGNVAEFHADTTALYETVLDLFYVKK